MSESSPIKTEIPDGHPLRATKKKDLLTATEHRIVQRLGDVASLFSTSKPATTPECDVREFLSAIHICQNIVLARAAARAYPIEYRL